MRPIASQVNLWQFVSKRSPPRLGQSSDILLVGAGPVGLMAAYSAVIRGASNVFVVDQVKERLDQAVKIGCTPINFREGDPVEQIIKKNGGMVDRAVDGKLSDVAIESETLICEAVGYQAVDKDGSKEQPNIVLDQLIMVTRPTGGLGIPGLYVPSDPGAPDAQSGKGQILISFGRSRSEQQPLVNK